MKRSWKAGIKKQAVILGIWAAAGALLTGCRAAGGSGTGNRLRMQRSLPWIFTRTASRC